MSNPNPCVRTRWQPGQSGNPNGSRKQAAARRLLARKHKDGVRTNEDAVLDHLLEMATRWQVRTVAYDHVLDEPIQVASGRDAVEAAKLLLGYVWGKPKDNDPLRLAEHFRQVEIDRLNVALKMLGDRVNSWQPERVRDFLNTCSRDPRGFILAAEEYLRAEEEQAAQGAIEDKPEPAQLPEKHEGSE